MEKSATRPKEEHIYGEKLKQGNRDIREEKKSVITQQSSELATTYLSINTRKNETIERRNQRMEKLVTMDKSSTEAT